MNKPARPRLYYPIRLLIFAVEILIFSGILILLKIYLDANEYLIDLVITPIGIVIISSYAPNPFKSYQRAINKYKAAQEALKRTTAEYNGAKIHHDWLIKGLGLVCLLFAVVLLYVFLTESYQVDKPGETTALIGLLTVLGLFAFLFVLEGFFVKGFCNKSTVHFMTPWTGTKDEKWQDIESVKFNVWCQWLVITFRSGKIIRLTPYLQGWKFALDVLKERGHDF